MDSASILANGKKIRGVDTSLIIEGSRKRQRVQNSPDNTSNNQNRSRWATGWAYAVANDSSSYEEVRKRGTALYDKLCSQKDPHDNDRFLHRDFTRLPSRTDYPDYYEMIKKPIDFTMIKDKLDKLDYQTVAEVRDDLNQVFVNAKRYNAPGSQIFLDAKKLHKSLKDVFANWTGEDIPPDEDDAHDDLDNAAPSTPAAPQHHVSNFTGHPPPLRPSTHTGPQPRRGPTLRPWLQRKMNEFVQATDALHRRYADSFWTLPDRTQWPDYYRIITNPIAFDMIRAKIDRKAYQNVKEYVDDVELLLRNAMFFNEESSRIWKDAKFLELRFREVMKEQPPEFVPHRTYNTKKKREQEKQARVLGVAPGAAGGLGSDRKRRRSSAGISGSEPPEYNGTSADGREDDDQSDDDGGTADHGTPTIDLPSNNMIMRGSYPPNNNGLKLEDGSSYSSTYPGSYVDPSYASLLPPPPPPMIQAPPIIIAGPRLISKLPHPHETCSIAFFLLQHVPNASNPLQRSTTKPTMIPTSTMRQHHLQIPYALDRIDLTPISSNSSSTLDKLKLSVRGFEAKIEPKNNIDNAKTWSVHLAKGLGGPASGSLTVVEILVGDKEAEVYRLFLSK